MTTLMAGDRVADPEAQAAITDFLDYTEYLPSDLLRSLTLIRSLDNTYLDSADAIDDLARQYGSLGTSEPAAAQTAATAQSLRLQMATHLNQALSSRETAYAEACRLFDMAERHQNRLKSIITKLNAIPKPPSRNPTPPPAVQAAQTADRNSSSPQKVSRSGRKLHSSGGLGTGTNSGTGTPAARLTLNPPRGGSGGSSSNSNVATALLSRPRGRRIITVPGEVMPPYDPDEAIASTEVSDWGSPPPPSPPSRPVLKLKQQHKTATSTLAQQPKERGEKPPRAPREHVTYRKPTPPPEDAELGGKYRPWTHLTEYEMYRLRKKMKKNHEWEPSQVMIRRELEARGRGWDNYYKAKAEAEKNGTPFIYVDSSAVPEQGRPSHTNSAAGATIIAADPGKSKSASGGGGGGAGVGVGASGSVTAAAAAAPVPVPVPTAAPATTTPTTKKNEGKRDKKADPARDRAAAAAQEAELAARRLGDIGSAFKNLFSPISSALANLNRSTSSPTTGAAISPTGVAISPTNPSLTAAAGASVTVAGAASASAVPKKTVTAAAVVAAATAKKRKREELAVSASPSAEPEGQRKKVRTPAGPTPAPAPAPSVPAIPAIPTAKTSQVGSEPPVPQSQQPQPQSQPQQQQQQQQSAIKIPLKLKVTGPTSSSPSLATTPVSAGPVSVSADRAASTARNSVTLKTEEDETSVLLAEQAVEPKSKSKSKSRSRSRSGAPEQLTTTRTASASTSTHNPDDHDSTISNTADDHLIAPAATSSHPLPISIPVSTTTGPPLSARRTSRRTTPAASTAVTTARHTPVAEDPSSPLGTNTNTAASRRPKREIPGTVMQTNQDGGAAVSISKRKSKPVPKTPRPKSALTPGTGIGVNASNNSNSNTNTNANNSNANSPEIRVDADGNREVIDPDEERYCICGDVSYGEMICCELDDKCPAGQWFHMECVGLVERPGRTVKWYCPHDRKKYKKGETSNGLVGRLVHR